MNQTLKNAMRKYASESQEDWDKELWRILMSVRCTVQGSTKMTPYELLYGEKVIAYLKNAERFEN